MSFALWFYLFFIHGARRLLANAIDKNNNTCSKFGVYSMLRGPDSWLVSSKTQSAMAFIIDVMVDCFCILFICIGVRHEFELLNMWMWCATFTLTSTIVHHNWVDSKNFNFLLPAAHDWRSNFVHFNFKVPLSWSVWQWNVTSEVASIPLRLSSSRSLHTNLF